MTIPRYPFFLRALSYCCCTTLERLQDDDDDSGAGAVDNDGFPVGRVPEEKKKIEALPPVDHSQIQVRGSGEAGGGRLARGREGFWGRGGGDGKREKGC